MAFDTTPRTLRDPIVMLIERYLQRAGVQTNPYEGNGGGAPDAQLDETVNLIYDNDGDITEVHMQTGKVQCIYTGVGMNKQISKVGITYNSTAETSWIDLIYNANGDIITAAPGTAPGIGI